MGDDRLCNSLNDIKDVGTYKYSEMRYDVIPKISENLKQLAAFHELTNHQLKDCSASHISELPKFANQMQASFEIHINELESNVVRKLDDKLNATEHFTIALFGRTKAGKSTLHQALTNGSGDTIGKGGQRTTRDLKRYYWGNMQIIDTPGTSAYGGEEDEAVAYEVMNEADLVLFLVTDDSIQESEFHNLKFLKELHKPILILLNIKIDLARSVKRKKFLANYHNILQQGKEGHEVRIQHFTSVKWDLKDIPIIPFHAQAAFLSTQEDDSELCEALFKASQLEIIKEKINELVNSYGKQFRLVAYRNFVISYLNEIVLQSADYRQQLEIINEQLTVATQMNNDWLLQFKVKIEKDLEASINNAFSSFETEIFKFLQDVELGKIKKGKKELEQLWTAHVAKEEKKLKQSITTSVFLLNEELRKQFEYLKKANVFTYHLDLNVKTMPFHKINKKIMKTLLILIPLITMLTSKLGPAGFFISTGVSIITHFAKKSYGKDGDHYLTEWKNLKAEIKESIKESNTDILKHVTSMYKSEIYKNAQAFIKKNDQQLASVISNFQSNTAKLNSLAQQQLLNQNKLLLDDLFDSTYTQQPLSSTILNIVRHPGKSFAMLTTASQEQFNDKIIEQLSDILHEHVEVSFWQSDTTSMISDALQIDASFIQQCKHNPQAYVIDQSFEIDENKLLHLNTLYNGYIEINKGAVLND